MAVGLVLRSMVQIKGCNQFIASMVFKLRLRSQSEVKVNIGVVLATADKRILPALPSTVKKI